MLPIEHDARIHPKTQRDPSMVFSIGPVYPSATHRGCDAFDADMVTASSITAHMFFRRSARRPIADANGHDQVVRFDE
jgi:hypothetical protein